MLKTGFLGFRTVQAIIAGALVLCLLVMAAATSHVQVPAIFSSSGSAREMADGSCEGTSEVHVSIPPEMQPYVTGGTTRMHLDQDCSQQVASHLILRPG